MTAAGIVFGQRRLQFLQLRIRRQRSRHARLREKLPCGEADGGWITTVRGKGYELAAGVEVEP